MQDLHPRRLAVHQGLDNLRLQQTQFQSPEYGLQNLYAQQRSVISQDRFSSLS